MCNASALGQNEVVRKVVLCDNITKIDVSDQMEKVERAGPYAGIFLVDMSDLQPDDFIIPSLILDTASGTLVRKYVTEDSKAKVKGMRFMLTKLGTSSGLLFIKRTGSNQPIRLQELMFWQQSRLFGPFIEIGKYKLAMMKRILRPSQWNCSQESTDLNYPSFMAIFNNETVRKFSRVVTNVGDEEVVYHANLKLPTGMKITIEPSTLTFTWKYQKQNFVLSIETDKEAPAVKANLDESYVGYGIWLPNAPKVQKPRSVFNAAALAYIGDCIYESERRGRPKGLKNKIRPEIRRMLGKTTLHYVHARFKEAKSVLTEVVMLNPCLPDMYHTLGLVYDTIDKC
ncbi:hypothetical protein LWI28_019170 [Acer negundo]|uniref:Subtilisin-like protease fibronectin type-III domain-containing protein n=1 Tax=Acer negundo TaxID=4023 RepID=A0AAD5IF42_ACENE|nr:hypothetical protein LWI28_019170 [Acer negundo]